MDGTAPSSLHPKKGCQALELIRLRFGNSFPIGVQYTTVVTELCPDLHTQDFESESLYTLLLKRYKLPIAWINQVVSAIQPDEWHKNLLKMPDHLPLLRVNATVYLDNDEPIEASTSNYRVAMNSAYAKVISHTSLRLETPLHPQIPFINTT